MILIYYTVLPYEYSNVCTAEANQSNKLYETMKLKLNIFQSQTKKRVASYIIVFIVTGIFSKEVIVSSSLVQGSSA